MSRIRSTKPEFWASEQIMDTSPLSVLLFKGLWTFCDDSGVHKYSLRRIKAQIASSWEVYTPEFIDQCLQELEKNKLIVTYTVNDQKYLRVTGWSHQKIDKPTFVHPLENGKIPFKKPNQTKEQLDNDSRDFAQSSRKRRELKNFLIQRDGNQCKYCGSTARTLTVDHIIPQSKGGSDHTDNLCLACRRCNTLKSNKLISGHEVVGKESSNGQRPVIEQMDDQNIPKTDENSSENSQTVQKIISLSPVTPGVECSGVYRSSLRSNNINNIEDSSSKFINTENKNKTKRGRPKKKTKWNTSNWEQIPDDIAADFEVLYYRLWPKPLKGRVAGLVEYANMNDGQGASEEEHKQMCSSINAQKQEANLKEKEGKKTWWPRIDTWIRNRSFEDEVDLSAPKSLKPKSTATKFVDNVLNSMQQSGEV